MGAVYRRTVRVCRTCARRLDLTAARRTCEGAGPSWPSPTSLVAREAPADARPVTAAMSGAPVAPIGFDEAAAGLIADYQLNGKRSMRTLTLRINKHLRPFFGRYRSGEITPPLVRTFTTQRHAAGAVNATINRDLITLKRMLTLAVQDGTLATKPYIPLLKEQNVRRGFFEPEQLQRIQAALPPYLRGIPAFAWITGWRTPSEILPLEWRQVDFVAGEVRLEPGTTKNGVGRVFPFTAALRAVLEAQQQVATDLTRQGVPTRYVFCYPTGRKAGQRISEAAYIHRWWAALEAAGCPTRIPHDFRRTAVRNLVRAGVPERVAMQLTGHKTRAVFECYNIVSLGDLREAAQRLDAFGA